MSRIRTIKPDAFRSETLSQVSLEACWTFFGLLTEADDDGRLRDRPAVLNGALWSLRPSHTVDHMERDIAELAAAPINLLCRYEVDGANYIHLPSFKEHQRVNRATASKIPSCPRCPVSRGGGVAEQPAGDPDQPELPRVSGGTVTPFVR